ncbi:AIPR family protein [Candidatus Binatus sp.]|uniref:AIPR family protein n=1 Tax=Candidatus Binatus sp. TaxID=2811406 RepID=UPI003C425157
MYEQILKEMQADSFYKDNFPNDGQRFVAWYLHRVLLMDVHQTKAAITDGANDKQIDAIVVEDGEERLIRIIQGKFVKPEPIDAEPLREVLSAWTRLKDLPRLQLECSGKLAERLEAMRVGLQDEYDVQFELLTTGQLSPAAVTDFNAFKTEMAEDTELSAGLTLVDTALLETRLSEAEQRDLPELSCEIEVDPDRCLVCNEGNIRVVLALLPVERCLKLPGIADGKLFRRNVRQSLGIGNKVNKALRATLVNPERAPYFFFFHNGITALCKSFNLSADKKLLKVRALSVVNGCQSLSTIYATSGKVAQNGQAHGSVLFRFYEISQYDLGEAISINTNSQTAVKPRDLRSNDRFMREIKKRYEAVVPGAYFITKRGEERPADRDAANCVDSPDYAKMVISWQCQRPNLATNETRLFDELYKTLFHSELDPQSILALRMWLGEIDKQWAQLDINEAVKAVKGAARFHMMFIISQLVAHASNQSDKVPLPSATMGAIKYSGMILAQAKQCLNQSLLQAVAQSTAAGKVFSPQNWLKSRGAVSDEQLVAGTIVNVLRSLNTPEFAPIMASISIPADKFSFRWSAE